MTALTTNTPQRLVLAPGRLYVGSTLVGVTEGPITVEIERTIRQVSAEGVTQAVQGLEYPVSEVLRISCALKELHDANITLFANHGQAPTGTTPNLSWVTPLNYTLLASGMYVTQARVLAPATDGTFVGYEMAQGLVTQAVINTPSAPGETTMSVTIESRATLAAPNGKTYSVVRRNAWPT